MSIHTKINSRNRDVVMKRNLLLLILLCTTGSALAQSIYSWKDENGVMHFGDRLDNASAKVIQLEAINSYGADKVETSEASPTPKAKTPNIVMYSAAWCGVCKTARAYFKKNKVKFSEYDVETSAKGRSYYAKVRRKSVPIFLIDGSVKRGFSPSSFAKLLGLNKG